MRLFGHYEITIGLPEVKGGLWMGWTRKLGVSFRYSGMDPIFTILVVDDNEVSRLVCRRALEHHDYRVAEAEDGRVALDQLAAVNPDLILLDVMMPGLSGFEVLAAIREQWPRESLPVIMATARDRSADVVRAFELGANDYITKPVEFPVLLARVQAQLRSRLAGGTASGVASVQEIGAGTVLEGKYRVESRLGTGNFGEVFRATHLALKRPVALKLLHADVEPGSEEMERFILEGIAACRIDHPNAVAVLDFSVTSGGVPFLVMELLKGETLEGELQRKGRLAPSRCAEILSPVAGVLSQLHEAGLVHRDVKPGNIFLHRSRHGEVVKVLDFGIASLVGELTARPDNQDLRDNLARTLGEGGGRLTAGGELIGTPLYMAPERITGEPSDGRGDVYSLGVVLYELLSGRRPFEAPDDSSLQVLKMHLTRPPPPLGSLCPELAPEVAAVVHSTLEKLPENRPSAAQLARRFSAAVAVT